VHYGEQAALPSWGVFWATAALGYGVAHANDIDMWYICDLCWLYGNILKVKHGRRLPVNYAVNKTQMVWN